MPISKWNCNKRSQFFIGCSKHAVEEHEIPTEYFVTLVHPSEEQKKIRTIKNQGNFFCFCFWGFCLFVFIQNTFINLSLKSELPFQATFLMYRSIRAWRIQKAYFNWILKTRLVSSMTILFFCPVKYLPVQFILGIGQLLRRNYSVSCTICP